MGFEGFTSYIGILDSVLFQPICLVYVITISFLLTILVGLGCCVGRPFNISLVLWLPWVCPAPIGRTPWARDFNCWSGFFPSLALLYKACGVGDCKGLYALTGSLLACMCGTQYWVAMQHTHNYAYSRVVHVLHTRVVTIGGKTMLVLVNE